MRKPRIKANYTIEHILSYVFVRMKKINPNIDQKLIRKVIKRYFELCADDIALGNTIYLGGKLGNLYLEKSKKEIKYDPETNQITNNLPINFPETLKLWKEYPELKNKRYIRFTNEHSNGYIFRLKYEVSKANFKNKQYFNFKYSKPVKDKLSKNIIDKKTDAFLNKYSN